MLGRILCLCGALGLSLGVGACRPNSGAGVPPPPSQRVQEIKNNPHIPQSIKEAAERQARGMQPAPGAQVRPK
jgi:hypothetical protein